MTQLDPPIFRSPAAPGLPRDGAPTRRRFLSAATAAVASVLHRSGQAQTTPSLLPPYLTDIDGNGQIGIADWQLVTRARFARRGFALTPAPGYDHRLDLFGRGSVDQSAIDAALHSLDVFNRQSLELVPVIPVARPITVAWHYGWYNRFERPAGMQTVRLKGGNYVSRDPEVETAFHDLKNEFGVTVDALSWIPPRANKDNQTNYRQGFLQAPNAGSRYVCLLYESTLALPHVGDRIDFARSSVSSLLLHDFAEMARFLREVHDDSPARVFCLDGRPVVFIFGSHAWGRLPTRDEYYRPIDTAIAAARYEFARIFGTAPYLVGEEMSLSSAGIFSSDRLRRTASFDAIYVYHHASNLKGGQETTLHVSPAYIDNQLQILRNTYAAVATVRNRFTGQPILVIPNLAPGFAKPNHPTLLLGRSGYADFMKLLHEFHQREYLGPSWAAQLETPRLPAPVYVVGSWNEEFEGHCLFPFDFNFSVPEVVQQGFDLAMSLKEVFGWNHYAVRDIRGSVPKAADLEPDG